MWREGARDGENQRRRKGSLSADGQQLKQQSSLLEPLPPELPERISMEQSAPSRSRISAASSSQPWSKYEEQFEWKEKAIGPQEHQIFAWCLIDSPSFSSIIKTHEASLRYLFSYSTNPFILCVYLQQDFPFLPFLFPLFHLHQSTGLLSSLPHSTFFFFTLSTCSYPLCTKRISDGSNFPLLFSHC